MNGYGYYGSYGQDRAKPLYDRFGNPLGAYARMYPAASQPQIVYDGLGNPVGVIPVIAALAAKFLPLVAKAVPFVTKALPQIASILPGLGPPAPGTMPQMPPPNAPPPTVPSPTVQIVPPGAAMMTPMPPTIEECRRLYPILAQPMPGPRRRRRPRIIVRRA